MDEELDPEHQKEVAIVDGAVAALMEHFDTVQVFVTRYTGVEGTVNINTGSGNWFARRGQVEAWLVKENERSVLEVHED